MQEMGGFLQSLVIFKGEHCDGLLSIALARFARTMVQGMVSIVGLLIFTGCCRLRMKFFLAGQCGFSCDYPHLPLTLDTGDFGR